MSKKNNIIIIKIKNNLSKTPNPWHQEQVMKGGKIHKNKSKLIPRKKKYKDKEVKEYG